MPGRDDDMDWLYGDERRDPGDPADGPTRARGAVPPSTPTDPPGATGPARRRASFGEDPDTGPRATGTGPRTRAMGSTRPMAAAGAAPSHRGRASTAPRPSPVAEPPRVRRRRRPARTVMALLALVLVGWLVFLVATPAYAWGASTRTDAWPAGQRPADQPGETWLLVGSDSREGLSDEEKKELGTGSTDGKRTDTIMLLHVPPSGRPALVSIPRDSYVDIPGKGKNKINAAYAFGGEKLLVQTIEKDTGIRVDHYAEIGFGGFAGVVDALGGVEMCPKKAIKDHNSHLDIPAGCQTMNGPTALGYARMRYADPTGDLGRMNRQRELVGAIVKKAASPMTVLNPFRWWAVNQGAAKALRTDRDSGPVAMAGLSGPLRAISSGEGLTLMVPVSNPNASTRAGSAMIWDDKKSKEMFAEIARGDTSKLERFKA